MTSLHNEVGSQSSSFDTDSLDEARSQDITSANLGPNLDDNDSVTDAVSPQNTAAQSSAPKLLSLSPPLPAPNTSSSTEALLADKPAEIANVTPTSKSNQPADTQLPVSIPMAVVPTVENAKNSQEQVNEKESTALKCEAPPLEITPVGNEGKPMPPTTFSMSRPSEILKAIGNLVMDTDALCAHPVSEIPRAPEVTESPSPVIQLTSKSAIDSAEHCQDLSATEDVIHPSQAELLPPAPEVESVTQYLTIRAFVRLKNMHPA